MSTHRETLDRLDARHDELIRKLDELNAQIEQALAQFAKSRGPTATASEVANVVGPATEIRRAA